MPKRETTGGLPTAEYNRRWRSAHLERAREIDRKKAKGFYVRCKAEGRCIDCRKPALEGQVRCEFHASEKRKESKRSKRWLRDSAKSYRRAYWRALRLEVLRAYGNACKCCGESGEPFLTIDHENGGGAAHRKGILGEGQRAGATNSLYLWLRRQGYPEGFQVLCWNCNVAKGTKADCPHKTGFVDLHGKRA